MIFRKVTNVIKALAGQPDFERFAREFTIEWHNFALDFNQGMDTIDLVENFQSQIVELGLDDSTEKVVTHKLGFIPRWHIELTGVAGVRRGPTAWTKTTASFILDADIYSGISKSVTILLLR